MTQLMVFCSAAKTAFQRILLPEYSDGVWKGKTSSVTAGGGGGGGDLSLPSARLVSINVVPDVDSPSELDTHHVMQWGQFVDHDITHTPLFRSPHISILRTPSKPSAADFLTTTAVVSSAVWRTGQDPSVSWFSTRSVSP